MKYIELMKLKNEICNNYISLYEKKGFKKIQSLPLDNKKDITVDYTTCTICSAKDNIINNVVDDDYVMIQPALRNTHINNLSNVKDKNYFLSYFTMIGGFRYYNNNRNVEKFSEVIESEFDFLSSYGNQVILTIPIQYKKFLQLTDECFKYLKDKKCEIYYSENDEENLKWKYGIGGVEGYGTRWEISNGGDLVNYGNTINVIRNGIPFGVDFGGGLESIVYANQKLKSSIYANDALTDYCSDFCKKNDLNEKIIDCIVSAMCIISNKEKIILRDKIILDTYMRILYSLTLIEDISREQILSIVKDIDKQNIPTLKKEKIEEIFSYYLSKIDEEFFILIESKNINKVLQLVNLCYNENNEWLKSKRIVKSHYKKYFSNLSEVDLLALKKKKCLILEGEKNND